MKPSELKVVPHEYSNKLDNSEGGETNKISKNKNNLLILEGYDDQSKDIIQIQTTSELDNKSKESQVNKSLIKSRGIFVKMCKEIMNIPLISGVISIILTVIPGLNDFITNKDMIFYKTFLGTNILN